MVQGAIVGIIVLAAAATLVALHRAGWMTGVGPNGFLIRYRTAGSIDVRGHVPRSKVLEIKEFCARNLASDRPFTIRGTWGAGKTLTLRWTGGLSPAQRQRARNFLIQCLD
ncbi:hypothetical protein [Singulisphaera acidiphila]|uniref:Uncharacterized protein n=1 Tax=Singulisphaera acidiphila (strain ATCC BAA-1392 / DSM 18658 / VKM B-2454 / MOB10) TaxID=886293 RepID=L0DEZ0_SINAD|nr:hypothetical protein [Singulisphaera acidiphila]AGA27410.1 hypothetical protein Sinac_3137 [Singulisphaera acidiphila DSM 18658]